MKKLLFKLFTLFTIVALIQSCNEPFIQDQSADEFELKSAGSAKTSYIVLLNDDDLNTELLKLKGYEKKQGAVKSASSKILKRTGINDGEIGHVYGTAVKGFSVKIAPGQLKKLQNDPSVVLVEEDQMITFIEPLSKPSKRPGGGGGGTITPPEPEIPWGIKRVGGAGNGTGKTAWIIDTGIDLDHPDLNVNTVKSINFVSKDNSPNDLNGHGTHVAGIIAALNNSIGVVGVAAGAQVVAVRVLDRRGSGWNSDVIAGVDYVGENALSGDVANMSLGGGVSIALDNAVYVASTYNGKNIYFSIAAGNESNDANNHSPARVNGSNIYTISAMDINDKWAYFSNYGNPPVDYCAPGYNIKSLWKDGGYKTISGTSMAAPHVAGLLLSGWNRLNFDGYVIGDKDTNPDKIAHR